MDQPFEFATFDDAFLRRLNSIGKTWDDVDDLIKDFKSDLYEKLRKNLYCPYCRRRLLRKKEGQIDHIIYQSDYKNFTFQPVNLVIACKRCNNKKLDKNVLIEEYIEPVKLLKWNEYPRDKEYYTIIHPYFDIYYEHITIENNIFYFPNENSSKGLSTINMMKLDSLDLLEERVIESDSNTNYISKYISNPDQDEIVLIWANFLLKEHKFQKMIFDILIDLEKKKKVNTFINYEQYKVFKEIITKGTDKYIDRFDIPFKASTSFIKQINNITDSKVLEEAITQLEELYKLRNLNINFDGALYLATIFLIKLKEGSYNKYNITKYLAG